jgi:hypothetical protein
LIVTKRSIKSANKIEMASVEAAAAKMVGDKYRSFLYDEGEKSTEWRHGGPPSYDDINKLFEEGRTKVDDGLQS